MPDQDKKTDSDDNSKSNESPLNEAGDGAPALDPKIEEEASLDTEPKEEEDKNEEAASDSVPDPDQQPETSDDSTPFDDEKTDKAIDEIVAKEGDDLLSAQDAADGKAGVKPPRKHKFWGNKKVRYTILLLLFGGLVAAMVVPKSRYLILNTVGVRSSSSVVVVDSTTQLPLKGVEVTLGGQEAETDGEGTANFSKLRLGPTQLAISRAGFEKINRNVVIGWGSNPLGNFALKASGIQYVIEVKDYLSDKPVEGVEATDGQATAVSDKNGKITLTPESVVVAKDSITLSKAGYRSDKISLNEDPEKTTKTVLVPARKAVFVTRQSGKYDVYKSDIDGKNREVLLPGTGSENSNISLAVSPDGSRAALVSTRDNKRDSGGFLLSSVVLINTESGEKVTIGEAPQIQLIDWIGSRLIFQLGTSESTAGNRYTVIAYNYADNTRLQLASANKLTAVMSAQGIVYYAVGEDSDSPSLQLGLFKIKPDGSGKQRVFEGELETVLRTTYDSFSLQDNDGTWYTYNISNGSKTQSGSPSSLANRLYLDNSNRSRSLWAGQGALMSYDVAAAKDISVKVQSGLTYPVQWINDTAAIYRVSTGGETADYAVSVLGGSAHKISDVAASYGFAQSQ